TDEQQLANVYLSDENYQILEDELQETFRVSTRDLKNKTEKQKYKVRLVPPPVKIKLVRVENLYKLVEKDIDDNLDFKIDEVDIERYKVIEKIYDGVDDKKRSKGEKDLSEKKEKRLYSKLTLVAEISRYLNKSCILIEKVLEESKDGIEKILKRVNEYNELIFDYIIPNLFNQFYEIKVFRNENEEEIELTKDPGQEGYTVSAIPELVAEINTDDYSQYKDKSFHLDTYCFDSAPEKEFFWRLLKDGKIEKVYFTGMITNKQTNFYIKYIDPNSNTLRSYFPDFVVKNKEGEWTIFEVKSEYLLDSFDTDVINRKKESAEKLTKDSNWKYQLIPSKQVNSIEID
ncbi:MAG: type III restriction endonuclease, partial [bacterium]